MRRKILAAVVIVVCMLFGSVTPAWGATDAQLQSLKQQMDEAKASYDQASAETKDAEAAHKAAVTELQASKTALDKANQELEDAQNSSPATVKTMKDFLQWMQTQPSLTSDQVNDVNNALATFSQAPSSVTQYLRFGDSDDATSLSNMITVAGNSSSDSFLDKAASLRRDDGGSSTMISMTNMVYAQLNANWAAYNYSHSGWFPTPGGENLAQGYPDPFYGWYDDEKAIFDKAVAQDPSLESCRYTSSCTVYGAGHYLNIVNPQFSVIGLAFSYHNNQIGWAYDTGSYDGAFTVSQYRDYLLRFRDSAGNTGESAELVAAKERQKQAQQRYNEAARNEGLANTRYTNALQTTREKYAAYQAAKKAYEDAGGKETENNNPPTNSSSSISIKLSNTNGYFEPQSYEAYAKVYDTYFSNATGTLKDGVNEAEAIKAVTAAQNAIVELPNSVLHRLYNRNNGDHYFTARSSESNYLSGIGLRYEGTPYRVTDYRGTTGATRNLGIVLWSVYNPNTGEHLLVQEYEATMLAKVGWNKEQPQFVAPQGANTDVYRVYNPNATGPAHVYVGKSEGSGLVAQGWRWDFNGQPAFKLD